MTNAIFRLIDPPEGQPALVKATLHQIRYPWWRLQAALRADPDGAVLIRWDPQMQQGATGLFYGGTYEIHLGTRYAGWEDKVPFVLAHEIGHLVDRATFDRATQQALTQLLHDSPETRRRDDQMLNGEPIEYAHVHDHNEGWTRRDKHYYLMLNEAYADLFVAAFAPNIWEGHHPRFTHWTSDLDAVRDLTVRRNLMDFTDVPADGTHRQAIEKAHAAGILTGYGDGRFGPSDPVTRSQLASILDGLGLLDPKAAA